jgi:hypothetical protein
MTLGTVKAPSAAQLQAPVKYPRLPGYRPTGEENRYGAWYVKTTIAGASGGRTHAKILVACRNGNNPGCVLD